jgi:hypothetical protein
MRMENSRLSEMIEHMSGGNAGVAPELIDAFLKLSEMANTINNNQ